uniref:Uncharacterized protein n=1 Tax=Moniliophthora roreri TaxID=221103 RepID=A0A0W0G636_MONRR
MSSLEEALAPYLSVQMTIVGQISSLSAMYFFYGFYVLLFCACVYMMLQRQPDDDHPNRGLYLSLTVILFMFSTVFVVVYTIDLVHGSIVSFTAVKTREYEPLLDFLTHDVERTTLFCLELLFYAFVNIAAEFMLIHRCYLIWGSNKRVALPLIVASVLTNAVGIASTIASIVGYRDTTVESNQMLYDIGIAINGGGQIANAVVNSIVTLLTAGRIWWTYRQVRAHGIYTSDTLVHSVSRIILESGSLYPIMSIASLIVQNVVPVMVFPFDLFPLVVLSAGISPTLVIVRAKLGKNVESLQEQVSDIHFISRPAPQAGTTASSQSQVHSIGNPMGQAEVDEAKEAIVV